MNTKEDFKAPLIDQCRDQIRQAYVQSQTYVEIKGTQKADFGKFSELLVSVWKAAKHEGVTPDEFVGLMGDMYPELMGKVKLPCNVQKRRVAA